MTSPVFEIPDQLRVRMPREVEDPRSVAAALYRAKHFTLDLDATAFARRLAVEHGDLLGELAEFALPPFDNMAISARPRLPDGEAVETLHLWSNGRYRLFIKQGDTLAIIPGWNTVDQDGGLSNYRLAALPGGFEGLEKLQRDHELLLVIFLLLAQPRSHSLVWTEPRKAIRKGKVVRFMGSSEIVIRLDQPSEFRRLFHTGAHGTPRRHDVRRHWYNYGGDPAHEHAWLRTAEEPARYECACGRKRVERGPFERGDAGIGFVQQRYKIAVGQ